MTTLRARRPTAWRWLALALIGVVVAAGIALAAVLAPAERALSNGATEANSTVAEAFVLDIGASVLEGDTTGMTGAVGDGTAGGQVIWYRWRPNAADTASLAGTAYLLHDAGDAVPAAVQLHRGPAGAAVGDLTERIAPTAADPAAGAYEYWLPALAADEYFYLGIETAAPGAFLLSIWQPTPGGPANDDLVNAQSLDLVINEHLDGVDVLLASGTTATAGFEVDDVVGEPRTGTGTGSVWYSWVVPQDGARVDVVVAAGAASLHVYERADADGGDAEGIVIDTPLDEQPPDAGTWTPPVDGGAGQFDPTVLVPRDDLAAPGGATLTGAAGDALLLQVIGGGPFELTGTISGIVAPDLAAPTWTCTSEYERGGADWARTWAGEVETPVTIACDVTDDRELDHPEAEWYTARSATTGEVVLTATAAAGVAAPDVRPEVRLVCDTAGNCAQVGVGVAVQIDNAPPTLRCDPAPTVWIHGADSTPPDGLASSRLACAAADDASGLADPADAAFERVAALDATTPAEDADVAYTSRGDICDRAGNCVAVPVLAGAKIDRKAPTVVCGDVDVPASGWFADDVRVECAATDAGSGLANAAQATTTITTSVAPGTVDPAAASAAAQVCDAVGNCADLPRLTDLPIDRAAPLVDCDPPAPWNAGTSLDLRCTAADQADGSGLADTAAADFVVTLTIPAGTEATGLRPAPREVCDVAGNCAGLPALAGVGLDDRGPDVVCGAAPTAWQRTDATVSCTATDAGSGLADPADAAFDLTTAFGGTSSETVAFVAPKPEICDEVGNCTAVPLPDPVRIDRVDPQVTCVKPVDGAYDFNVTIACTATDADSGLAAGATLEFVLRTAVVPGTAATGVATNSREVCDLAGNCVVFGPYGAYDIDLTAAPTAPAPAIDAPGAVDVLAAVPAAGFTGTRAPFAPPTVESEIGAVLDCAPDGAGVYPIGSTEVTCTARDAADRVVEARFPVRVALAPELAATGPVPLDRLIPVAGTGFVGPVDVEVSGAPVATLSPSGGAVAGEVAVPSGVEPGSRLVVLRGVGADGDPRLVVKPVTIVAAVGPAPDGDPAPGDSGPGSGAGAAGPDAHGGPGGPGGDAVGGLPSAAVLAQQAERGLVLDPERWPTERIEDGGGVHEDDGTVGAVDETAGLSPVAVGAIVVAGALVLGGAAAGGVVLLRRRGVG